MMNSRPKRAKTPIPHTAKAGCSENCTKTDFGIRLRENRTNTYFAHLLTTGWKKSVKVPRNLTGITVKFRAGTTRKSFTRLGEKDGNGYFAHPPTENRKNTDFGNPLGDARRKPTDASEPPPGYQPRKTHQ